MTRFEKYSLSDEALCVECNATQWVASSSVLALGTESYFFSFHSLVPGGVRVRDDDDYRLF